MSNGEADAPRQPPRDKFSRTWRIPTLLAVVIGMACLTALAMRSSHPGHPRSKEEIDRVVDAFRKQLDQDGSIIFRSWDGKWIGADRDTDLQFLPGRKVKLIMYGEGVTQNRGEYRIDDDGAIVTVFSRTTWPRVLLEKDSRSLLLRPADERQVIPHRSGSFWPFRPILIAEQEGRFHD